VRLPALVEHLVVLPAVAPLAVAHVL